MLKEGQFLIFSKENKEILKKNGSVISDSALISDKNVSLANPVHLSPRTQIQSPVRLGKFCFLNWDVIIFPNVEMGSFCSVGRGVQIGVGSHPINYISTHQFTTGISEFKNFPGYADNLPRKRYVRHEKTSIGHDVWIGANAVIKAGVNIGTGAVIAAGAVVVKDVMPYEIVGGVPAKNIGFRFDEVMRTSLLASNWWELPITEILKSNIYSPNDFLSSILNK